jgi:3-oxo-5-alpha-steroid 4-dehydrogenase 1
MTDMSLYNIIMLSFTGLGIMTLVALLFISAPYGRHARKGWGPSIHASAAWILMELPAPLLLFIFYIYSDKTLNPVFIIFLIIWEYHYFYRTFIYPFTLKNSKPVSLSIVLMALIFNSANGYLQGTWLFTLAPDSMYTLSWLYDPRFIVGIIIFITGSVINRHSDAILRALREGTESGYKIPYGGLYKWISCPNYFGEIVEWVGWAVLTWSLAGTVFVFWTMANLLPRALTHHRWYSSTFDDYPDERKAIIPYVL